MTTAAAEHQEDEEDEELGVWVQCDACDKWRQLLRGVPEPAESDPWYCHQNDDMACNSCDAPEVAEAKPRGAKEDCPEGFSKLWAHFEENGIDVALLEGWSCVKRQRRGGKQHCKAYYTTFHGPEGQRARSLADVVRATAATVARTTGSATSGSTAGTAAPGKELIGSMIEILWPLDQVSYPRILTLTLTLALALTLTLTRCYGRSTRCTTPRP